jgi:glycosyltransferase involved in cell wall biosynthesis
MPTYNEAQSLASTVEGLLAEVVGVDVLIVDDNSHDGTPNIAESLSMTHPRVSVLHRPLKQGLGPAYIDGFRYAFSNGYQVVVEMDADGSHQASNLTSILGEMNNADLVIGSRWIKE